MRAAIALILLGIGLFTGAGFAEWKAPDWLGKLVV